MQSCLHGNDRNIIDHLLETFGLCHTFFRINVVDLRPLFEEEVTAHPTSRVRLVDDRSVTACLSGLKPFHSQNLRIESTVEEKKDKSSLLHMTTWMVNGSHLGKGSASISTQLSPVWTKLWNMQLQSDILNRNSTPCLRFHAFLPRFWPKCSSSIKLSRTAGQRDPGIALFGSYLTSAGDGERLPSTFRNYGRPLTLISLKTTIVIVPPKPPNSSLGRSRHLCL